jgi:ATP synthase protein I
MLLIIGLAIGCLNAWHWVTKENKEIGEEPEDKDE